MWRRSYRHKDVDDEYIKLVKATPNFIVDPNPHRGVKADRTWLRDSMTAAEFQNIQADTKVIVAATRNAAELMRLEDAGIIAVRKSADFVAGAHRAKEFPGARDWDSIDQSTTATI